MAPPRIRLAALAAGLAAVALVLVVVLTEGGESPPERPRGPSPTATPSPTPTPVPLSTPAPGPSLAVGITEPNPHLYAPEGLLAGQPAPWPQWRDELAAIRPALLRVVVEWNKLQPAATAPPDLAMGTTGCLRDKLPCAGYFGLQDQLRALAARQREGGWEGLVVFTGTPDWAAEPATGCREDAGAGILRRDALPAYRRLVRSVFELADSLGAKLRYATHRNEPNHPYFLSPQRATCDPGSPSLAVEPYRELAQALRAEMRRGQTLVLGEMAGVREPTARATSMTEMIRGLPRRLVCSAPVWSQHAYVGGTDPVQTVAAALAEKGCEREHAIWITETGVGPAPGGFSLARGITSEAQGCRLLHRRLTEWYRDPRVTLAVQYTLREDDLFPTGLVTTDLTRERPALREWQAWGARESLGARPPRRAC